MGMEGSIFRPGTSATGRSDAVTPVCDPGMTPGKPSTPSSQCKCIQSLSCLSAVLYMYGTRLSAVHQPSVVACDSDSDRLPVVSVGSDRRSLPIGASDPMPAGNRGRPMAPTPPKEPPHSNLRQRAATDRSEKRPFRLVLPHSLFLPLPPELFLLACFPPTSC